MNDSSGGQLSCKGTNFKQGSQIKFTISGSFPAIQLPAYCPACCLFNRSTVLLT